ncbi:MAG: 30S ribosomal protein S15 [Mycobacteriaceae bacterium]|nr:30S ribosomal protein S15 [Mycobacteriaceae bacterium]
MSISDARRTQLVKEYGINAKDTGSAQVQVAILTERIRELSEHIKLHKQDFSSRRGLNQMVSRRTRLSEYLKENDRASYSALITRLGLRK